MLFGHADIYIKSDKTLEEVGIILSRELFGGLPFVGRENSIRDELPTIYIEPEILGLEIILMGGDVDGVCVLEISPSDSALNPADEEEGIIDVSARGLEAHLKLVLRQIEGIRLMSEDEVKEFEAQFES